MQRKMLRGKIHRATITEANLHYQGSVTIDADLMEAADLIEFEQVEVWNITNGNRFSTYTILGERGSGTICINGAAAHKATTGDMVIIANFGWMSEDEARRHKPRVVLVDEANRIVEAEEPFKERVHVAGMLI
jgi:aspartate 1-decarboxylase